MKRLFMLLFLVLCFSGNLYGQGLTSASLYQSFISAMHNDNLTFPSTETYQLINIGTEMACTFGFAYPKVDTLVLATGTEEYGLEKTTLWVYRVGKIGEGERTWQRVALGDLGKYDMQDALNPKYWDFITIVQDYTSTFSAGKDTSYIYVYPKPTSGDNGDNITVHYFAWADTINSNLKATYGDVVLKLSLMCGYFRKGRSDLAVVAWNDAKGSMNEIVNRWLQTYYDIEVVTKNVGGR